MAFPTDPIYKLLAYGKDETNGPGKKGVTYSIQRADGTYIPLDPENTEYAEYLKWVAAGNTAEAADPGPSDWDIARQKRDQLIKDSDWTMTTGATVDQAQWSAYREKLRDIPQTYKGKATSEIVWPTAPSTKGPNS
tara:strand:- start:52 stop:459 length:408 start_codon:yes stop_codon:yes gene_type:complete